MYFCPTFACALFVLGQWLNSLLEQQVVGQPYTTVTIIGSERESSWGCLVDSCGWHSLFRLYALTTKVLLWVIMTKCIILLKILSMTTTIQLFVSAALISLNFILFSSYHQFLCEKLAEASGWVWWCCLFSVRRKRKGLKTGTPLRRRGRQNLFPNLLPHLCAIWNETVSIASSILMNSTDTCKLIPTLRVWLHCADLVCRVLL